MSFEFFSPSEATKVASLGVLPSSFLMRFKVQNTHLWGLDWEDKTGIFAFVIE